MMGLGRNSCQNSAAHTSRILINDFCTLLKALFCCSLVTSTPVSQWADNDISGQTARPVCVTQAPTGDGASAGATATLAQLNCNIHANPHVLVGNLWAVLFGDSLNQLNSIYFNSVWDCEADTLSVLALDPIFPVQQAYKFLHCFMLEMNSEP